MKKPQDLEQQLPIENIVAGATQHLWMQSKNLMEILKNLWSDEIVINDLSLEDLPDNILKFFEAKSSLFLLPGEYKKWNFDRIWVIHHAIPIAYMTYFILQDKEFYDGSLKKIIYTYEQDLLGNKIGDGEVVVLLKDEWKRVGMDVRNKPFVWFTSTQSWRLKQWFGLMRLLHLNELSKNMLWYKLYSSIDLMDWTWAKRSREKLIELWKAEEDLSYTTFKRYRFI